jgi:hypothetical protein
VGQPYQQSVVYRRRRHHPNLSIIALLAVVTLVLVPVVLLMKRSPRSTTIADRPSLPPAVASENSIHLTRSHRRIRTRSSDDCNRLGFW